MTLEEKVRRAIGYTGPQLPHDEYMARIDSVLKNMTPAELLEYISLALGDLTHD